MEYSYRDAEPAHTNSYLWPVLASEIAGKAWPNNKSGFDLGCGNGATCDFISKLGFDVTGVDISESGVQQARQNFPHVKCELGSVYDDLSARYGLFDLVVSFEVIEHCFDVRSFAKTFLSLIKPGGIGIISTPYHGYLKNLALAATGKMDAHFTALWEGGHIKFFSIPTLRSLLRDAGAGQLRFHRVGRIPLLAKSMIAVIQN